MTKRDVRKLNNDAKKREKQGHKLSAIKVFKMSQQRRRSLY